MKIFDWLINLIFYKINLKFSIFLNTLYFIFIISLLIDSNRIPFDLIESESKLKICLFGSSHSQLRTTHAN